MDHGVEDERLQAPAAVNIIQCCDTRIAGFCSSTVMKPLRISLDNI